LQVWISCKFLNLWFCPNSRNFRGILQIPGNSDVQKTIYPQFSINWSILLLEWCIWTLSKLRIRVILETCTWKFPGISYFSDLRQTRCARNIPKTVLETTLITKKSTYTLDFRKYFVVSFGVTQLGHFQCFWKIEHYLRNLTYWE
jgi:hypothetical protein